MSDQKSKEKALIREAMRLLAKRPRTMTAKALAQRKKAAKKPRNRKKKKDNN